MNRKWERFGNDATSRRTEQLCVAFPSADLQERSVAWPFSGRQMLRRFFALFGKARTPDRFEAAPLRQSHPASAALGLSRPCLYRKTNTIRIRRWLVLLIRPRKGGRRGGVESGEQFVLAAGLLAVAAFAFAIPQISVKSNQ